MERGHLTRQVIRVCPDSILYLDAEGKPWTAWLLREEERLVLVTEPGFSVESPW